MMLIFGVLWLIVVVYDLKTNKFTKKPTPEDILALGTLATIFLASVVVAITNSIIMFLAAFISRMLITYTAYKKEKKHNESNQK
ncbi:hypothetical protein [Archaeoglobus sulfaticallidus]|nr:hypothetical protein [Archaeoglobus sulfaticallidus]